MEVRIETMTTGDLPGVAALSGQLGHPATVQDVTTRFAELGRGSPYAVFVARSSDDAGELLGYVQVSAEPEIAALVVDERVRGRGIGKALVRQAEAWAAENGVNLARVRADAAGKRVHREARIEHATEV